MKNFINKKSIAAALMAMSIFGATYATCAAYPIVEYTEYVDSSVWYTGAIIDCRGLGLSTAMSPVIVDDKGEKLYGYKDLDVDTVINKGMAGYVHSFSDPAIARAGSNPVVFKAIGTTNHGMYPVLEMADGMLLKVSNRNNHYFNKASVVFVY